jgi:hypothetical protein
MWDKALDLACAEPPQRKAASSHRPNPVMPAKAAIHAFLKGAVFAHDSSLRGGEADEATQQPASPLRQKARLPRH